jgi:putative transposase
VGLDVGITSLVTLSTGEKIANPRFSKTELTRQRRLARSLSRKKKGSNNAYKARQKLAKHHVRLADRRQDHLHKLSTRLVRENQVIVVESLRVRNMVKNRRLSAAISDAAWSSLFRMLEYKSAWYGRTYIEVDQFFPSSKTCSCCGCRTKELKLSTRRWTCPKCRVKHDRDINAARNILAAGHAVNVCGPGVSQRILRKAVQSGMKQKVSGVS